jgi:hypothetical protein
MVAPPSACHIHVECDSPRVARKLRARPSRSKAVLSMSMFPIPCNRPMALRSASSGPSLVAHLSLFSFHPRSICLIGRPLIASGYDRYATAISLITPSSCTQPANRHASHSKSPDPGLWPAWCSWWSKRVPMKVTRLRFINCTLNIPKNFQQATLSRYLPWPIQCTTKLG